MNHAAPLKIDETWDTCASWHSRENKILHLLRCVDMSWAKTPASTQVGSLLLQGTTTSPLPPACHTSDFVTVLWVWVIMCPIQISHSSMVSRDIGRERAQHAEWQRQVGRMKNCEKDMMRFEQKKQFDQERNCTSWKASVKNIGSHVSHTGEQLLQMFLKAMNKTDASCISAPSHSP